MSRRNMIADLFDALRMQQLFILYELPSLEYCFIPTLTKPI